MQQTVTRMAPGALLGEAPEALVEGWALTQHPALGPDRPADLLFLPGMAAGAWMWTPHFLEPLQRAGFRCWTITFSGRPGGQTLTTDPAALERALARALRARDPRMGLRELRRILPGSALGNGPGIDAYAAETEAALTGIGRPALVIGYSLGGAVAQAVLRRRRQRPAGVALLCSVPPYGLWRASLQMAALDPDLWRALAAFSLGGLGATDTQILRDRMFPRGVAAADFTRILANLRDESFAALLQSQGLPPIAPIPAPRRDVAVFGAAEDRLVPVADVIATAAWYGGIAKLLPRAGHMPMLGDTATATADALCAWALAEVAR